MPVDLLLNKNRIIKVTRGGRKFWESTEVCKQDKSFPKIKDFAKTEAHRAVRRTSGKPTFIGEDVWAEN